MCTESNYSLAQRCDACGSGKPVQLSRKLLRGSEARWRCITCRCTHGGSAASTCNEVSPHVLDMRSRAVLPVAKHDRHLTRLQWLVSRRAAASAAAAQPAKAGPDGAAAAAPVSCGCVACGVDAGTGVFSSQAEQREHFKSDWHRVNVKRRHGGRPPLSEAQFEQLISHDEDVSRPSYCWLQLSCQLQLQTVCICRLWCRCRVACVACEFCC